MGTTQQVISTPLGDLRISVVGLASTDYLIELVKPEIKLPEGMSVDGFWVALIRIEPSLSAKKIRCECVWDRVPAPADPEPGEHLDAQSWESDEHQVTVGTEDFEVLSRRLPDLGFTEAHYPVAYVNRGLIVEIPKIAIGAKVSLHFAVAWRSLPDPAGDSTWFAVDVSHKKIDSLFGPF